MTLPSTFARAVTSTLKERLGRSVREIRLHDGDIGQLPKDTIEVASPGVLVTCAGCDIDDGPYGVADAVWVAWILVNGAGKDEDGSLPGGIAAANIAFQIGGIVNENPWGALAYSAPTRARCGNERVETKDARKSGLAIWSCAWKQPLEITREDVAELNRLASIHHTFAMGDDDAPDAFATIEFPESSP